MTEPERVTREQLIDSLRRCLDCLDDLILGCNDPGTEALSAVYEARGLLYTLGVAKRNPRDLDVLVEALVDAGALTEAAVWDIPGEVTIAYEDDPRSCRPDARQLYRIGAEDS